MLLLLLSVWVGRLGVHVLCVCGERLVLAGCALNLPPPLADVCLHFTQHACCTDTAPVVTVTVTVTATATPSGSLLTATL